jgi:predicted nucleic acid-binding protein
LIRGDFKRTIVRMQIIVDSSAFLAVALDEPEKPWLLDVTRGVELAAPAVLPYELGNALSALVRRKRLRVAEAVEAWRILQGIPVELVEVDIDVSLCLAAEQGIYAYDAYFLQCAMQLKCRLLTLDQAMMHTARALKLKTVEKQ